MLELHTEKLRGYRLWLHPELVKIDPGAVLVALEEPANGQPSTLGGRGSVTHTEIPGLGRVVIKHYMRGGVLGRFIKRTYLRLGRLRSMVEFDLLERVRNLGINVPQPLAVVSQGCFFYRTWLITREVEEKRTLAELCVTDEERARDAMGELVGEVTALVRNGIYHIDLHPGNVLVREDGRIFIVDFDKACRFSGPISELRDRYIIRWRRAVIKHGLPQFLSEIMSWGLRSIKA